MKSKNKTSKVAWIVVLFHTPKNEISRLKREINALQKNIHVYCVDNSEKGKGYAAGVNEGIRRATKDSCDYFIVSNPDISVSGLQGHDWLEGLEYYDILGFPFYQNNRIYFGGRIDKNRLSGGLELKRPLRRFVPSDFVSGSLMGISKKTVETIGLFDETYFMYYEDVEFCKRAINSGLKVGIDTKYAYFHAESSNGSKQKAQWLFINRWKFFWKYSGYRQKIREIVRLPLTLYDNRNVVFSIAFSHTFLFNFFTLNISSFLTKLLNFLLFLFMIRYFNPEEYGIYTLVWAQVTLLSPLVDFGTTSYGVIHLPNEKKGFFHSVFHLRIFLSVIVFLLTSLLSVLLFGTNLKVLLYILFTSTVIFTNMFSGSYFIWSAYREKAYIASRNSIIFNTVLIAAEIIGIIVSRRLLIVFILIFGFYNLYSVLNLVFLLKESKPVKFVFDFKNWIKILKKSYIFVLITFFAGLYFKLDVFLLTKLKGEGSVGIYSAGYKFLDALIFIAASYNVSVAPIFARINKKRGIFLAKIKKDFVFLSFIGFFIAIVSYLCAPVVLPVLLQPHYEQAVEVTRIVMFALPFILVSSIWMNVIYVLNKAYLVVFVFLLQIVINFGLNFLLIPKFSFIASSYITVASEIINFVILLGITRILLSRHVYNS